ncbi:PLP-dependent transferase [Saccharopolyspora spinosa]|uniref:PLP-dependent transferase n=1 Tax=Saccharopolyspora spinosa TaxID=60894 RepID=UPI0023AE7F4F|nr:PLP-dependent transferase [Saccharopolyspora spinosa]
MRGRRSQSPCGSSDRPDSTATPNRTAGCSAKALASGLAEHPAVRAVHDPAPPTSWRKLVAGNSGVLTFDLGSCTAGLAFVRAVQLAVLGPSLGGIETLVLHPASTSHP